MFKFPSLPLSFFNNSTKSVRIQPELLVLEERAVPAVVTAPAIRSIDGSGNNLAHASWGQTGTDYIRIAAAAYGDGVSSPAGADRPSAREISNGINDQQGQSVVNDRMMSAMVYAWGQFIDHDLDLTASGTSESLPIAVPTGDSSFDPLGTGTKTIPMKRSVFDAATGTSTSNPRQQVNAITAWLDGSMIYGSDATTAASLRTMQGGQMKTSTGNLLPTDAAGNFLAGDVRVGENPELTSLQTLFVREHNRTAARIALANPTWNDEKVFQAARAWVIGEVQAITVNEWLPTLMGANPLKAYSGYKPNVNPAIANEFATAGFRFGHSIVGSDIEFLDNNGNEIAEPVSLAEAFFNPTIVAIHGIEPLLKYLVSDLTQEMDVKVVDELRNFLFGAPGQGGLDLASLNIQRGRDHGLSDYNTTRAAYGLPKVTNFAQITNDVAVQTKLQQLYGSVDKIDLWVGVMAEKHLPGASVGVLSKAIMVDQFTRVRDGDRFWYQNTFKAGDLQALNRTTLSGLIAANSVITNIQPTAFVFNPEVKGVLFGDKNSDGKLTKGEVVLANVTVQLVNTETGAVVATSITNPQGQYRFGVNDGLGLGTYQLKVLMASGTAVNGPTVTITRGDALPPINIGVPPNGNATPPAPPPAPPAPPAGAPPVARPRTASASGPAVDMHASVAFNEIIGALLRGEKLGNVGPRI
jgi:hypothetical protein